MPRLSPSVLIAASKKHLLLPLLLKSTRDLGSAQNELRWLREHARAASPSRRSAGATAPGWRKLLRIFCEQRAKGRPLQYVMGSQPFGDLEIGCKPGVLIPRPETESYTTHLANLLLARTRPEDTGPSGPPLRVLDLCTGTGCISLLLFSLLSQKFPNILVDGVDISPRATSLARRNLQRNVAQGNIPRAALRLVRFLQADVLAPNLQAHLNWRDGNGEINRVQYDVLISNPPYISPLGFSKETSRYVRNWEPKLALVPNSQHQKTGYKSRYERGDEFYPALLGTATRFGCQLVVFEVADLEQAKRVVCMARESGHWKEVEIWRDWIEHGSNVVTPVAMGAGKAVVTRGVGEGRAVVCWTKEWGGLVGGA